MSNFPKYRMPYWNPIKNSTQTIFQGGSPWATLILNSMFVLVGRYCVQLFLGWKKNQNHSLLSFFLSFANTFLFITFLVPFFWNSQKCPISQNIGCLIKTPLKKQHANNFSRGLVHEQPWSSIVCLFWWAAIVSNFFWDVKKNQNHYLLSFFLSFANTFLFVTFLVPFFGNSQNV